MGSALLRGIGHSILLLVLALACSRGVARESVQEHADLLIQQGMMDEAIQLLTPLCGATAAGEIDRYCVQQLGTAHLYARQYNQSAHAFRRIVQVLEAEHGGEGLVLLEPTRSLATALEYAGRWNEALTFRKRVVEILTRNFGAEDPRLASPLCDLAVVEARLENESAAISLLRRGIEVASAHDAKPTVALCAGRLALVHAESGKVDDAEYYFELQLRMLREAYANEDSVIASALRRYAAFLRDIGRSSVAYDADSEAELIERRLPGGVDERAPR